MVKRALFLLAGAAVLAAVIGVNFVEVEGWWLARNLKTLALMEIAGAVVGMLLVAAGMQRTK